MPEMKFCPSCGSSTKKDAKFCFECGEELNLTQEQPDEQAIKDADNIKGEEKQSAPKGQVASKEQDSATLGPRETTTSLSFGWVIISGVLVSLLLVVLGHALGVFGGKDASSLEPINDQASSAYNEPSRDYVRVSNLTKAFSQWEMSRSGNIITLSLIEEEITQAILTISAKIWDVDWAEMAIIAPNITPRTLNESQLEPVSLFLSSILPEWTEGMNWVVDKLTDLPAEYQNDEWRIYVKYENNTGLYVNARQNLPPRPSTSTPAASLYPREPNDENKAFAWTAAEKAVRDNLISPSTAKFPFSYYGQDIKEMARDTFVVKSYVDAQNAFGGTLRRNFMVKVERVGENTYIIQDVQIYE